MPSGLEVGLSPSEERDVVSAGTMDLVGDSEIAAPRIPGVFGDPRDEPEPRCRPRIEIECVAVRSFGVSSRRLVNAFAAITPLEENRQKCRLIPLVTTD